MNREPEFRIVPIGRLRGHEEHDPAKVDELVAELRRTGSFDDPIWVARGSWVILNGHHRVEAARRLGLKRVPAWVLDYQGEHVDLERWNPGPPIAKAEVLHRARHGRPFPPKTTRHRLRVQLPPRSVPLSELEN
jgi:L-serine kinase (ADP)